MANPPIKPLDFVRPKAYLKATGLVTMVTLRDNFFQVAVEWFDADTNNDKRKFELYEAWWDPDDLIVVDNLARLLCIATIPTTCLDVHKDDYVNTFYPKRDLN